jgi:hypothetical protein
MNPAFLSSVKKLLLHQIYAPHFRPVGRIDFAESDEHLKAGSTGFQSEHLRGLFILAEHYNAVVRFPAFAFGELREIFFILHSFILLIEKLVASSSSPRHLQTDEKEKAGR